MIQKIASTAILLFSVSVKETVATTDWTGLEENLSTGVSFSESDVSNWYNECILPYAFRTYENFPPDSDPLQPPRFLSNYELMFQPSGLCMDVADCAFDKCLGPITDMFGFGNPFLFLDLTTFDPADFTADPRLNLPAAVVHPHHVKDISESIKFAAENEIEVSIKTSGHSYTGSSTKKDTLNLNLSKLNKYSPDGSIVECQTDINMPEEFKEPCRLAVARNHPAVIRVGGGELIEEALRAVIGWNTANPAKPLNMISGASGTLSAAGGWLSSGGLSGNNGMRLFGLAVDQVLHAEMVLPDGRHVRFGPSSWDPPMGDKKVPQTKEVTGYCNAGDLSDESAWDWQECNEPVDFNALWFALRGGGGGAYGVTTSIYYQLQRKPGQFQWINWFLPQEISEHPQYPQFVEFMLRFLYLPNSIGVTELASNSCSASDGGGFLGGWFFCHNGAADIFKAAYIIFFEGNPPFHPDTMMIMNFDSFTDATIDYTNSPLAFAFDLSPTPEGRAPDIPPAFTTGYTVNNLEGLGYVHFPLDAVQNKLDDLVPIVVECMKDEACGNGRMYILGGEIPNADDGMNALPPHRRHNAFVTNIYDLDIRQRLERLFYGVEDGEAMTGDIFPGSLCHNHASPHSVTPLKEDWTQLCDPEWPEEEKSEKCYSYHEAAFGTENLMKLEHIHATVDPLHLFNCWDCVGYRDTPSPEPKKSVKKSVAKEDKASKIPKAKKTHKSHTKGNKTEKKAKSS